MEHKINELLYGTVAIFLFVTVIAISGPIINPVKNTITGFEILDDSARLGGESINSNDDVPQASDHTNILREIGEIEWVPNTKAKIDYNIRMDLQDIKVEFQKQEGIEDLMAECIKTGSKPRDCITAIVSYKETWYLDYCSPDKTLDQNYEDECTRQEMEIKLNNLVNLMADCVNSGIPRGICEDNGQSNVFYELLENGYDISMKYTDKTIIEATHGTSGEKDYHKISANIDNALCTVNLDTEIQTEIKEDTISKGISGRLYFKDANKVLWTDNILYKDGDICFVEDNRNAISSAFGSLELPKGFPTINPLPGYTFGFRVYTDHEMIDGLSKKRVPINFAYKFKDEISPSKPEVKLYPVKDKDNAVVVEWETSYNTGIDDIETIKVTYSMKSTDAPTVDVPVDSTENSITINPDSGQLGYFYEEVDLNSVYYKSNDDRVDYYTDKQFIDSSMLYYNQYSGKNMFFIIIEGVSFEAQFYVEETDSSGNTAVSDNIEWCPSPCNQQQPDEGLTTV